MPILGVVASGMSGHLWAPSSSDYQSISTGVVDSAGATSITFSSIPSTFTHLQIRWIGRIVPAVTDENLQLRVGTGSIDSTSSYSQHVMYGNGSTVPASGSATQTGSNLGRLTGGSSGASTFAVGVIDIFDYASTNKYKTFRGLSGHDQNGSGIVWFASGSWQKSTAIDTVQLNHLYGSGNFVQYSSFALYGVK